MDSVAAEEVVCRTSDNPVEGARNETFDGQARRDFIAPDQLGRLLDLGTVDRAERRQVRDRLVMLMYLYLGLRKNELAAVRVEDVRQLAQGKFQIAVDGASQKKWAISPEP